VVLKVTVAWKGGYVREYWARKEKGVKGGGIESRVALKCAVALEGIRRHTCAYVEYTDSSISGIDISSIDLLTAK
jgi:hypothetical protein